MDPSKTDKKPLCLIEPKPSAIPSGEADPSMVQENHQTGSETKAKVHTLTDKQIEAVAYLEKESKRWERMAKRCEDIGLPMVAGECSRFAKSLKAAIDLQVRVIRYPDQFLGFK